MTARRSAWIAWAALGLACAGARGGAGAPVRLEVPATVRWEEGGARELEVAVANVSGRTLGVAKPDLRTVQVVVSAAGASGPACRTPSPTANTLEPWQASALANGDRVLAKLDLAAACGKLPRGDYRYEVRYVSPPVRAFDQAWVGALGPAQGALAVVEKGAAAPAPLPGTTAAQARACVDAELERRGLDRFGNAAGTTYPDGTPVQDDGRVLYVAARHRDIRTACGIPSY